MGLYCWGLNHKSVPVAIREQYALSQAGQLKALDSWDEEGPFAELVLLCTCNRCELYAVTKDSIPSAALLDYYLSLLPGRPPVDSSYYYTYSGKDCITHLLRVASSLDSLILGEGQILSQVKQAYQQAHERGTTGVILNMLFQQAISTGKKVRTDTHIAYHAVSVSYAAVQLAERLLGTLDGHNLMIFGAGKMAELTAKHFRSKGAGELYIVNRHLERAEKLARTLNGKAVHWAKANEASPQVDILITSTGAPHYVLTKERAETMGQLRNHRPLLVIDIAVPRDVAPDVQEVPGITVYNIDQLTSQVEENRKMRQQEADVAEQLVEQDVAALLERFRYLPVRPALLRLAKKAEAIRKRELHRAMAKLPGLTPQQAREVENLSHMLVRKLLRDPMMLTVGSANTDKEKETVKSLSEFFQL